MSDEEIFQAERNKIIQDIINQILELTQWNFIDICKNVDVKNVDIVKLDDFYSKDKDFIKKLVIFIWGFLRDYEKLEYVLLNDLRNPIAEVEIENQDCDNCEPYAFILNDYKQVIEDIRFLFKEYPIIPSFYETDKTVILLLGKMRRYRRDCWN